ncbi:L-fucose/L-arabinose isomerase family protein [Caproiciproducens sp.]
MQKVKVGVVCLTRTTYDYKTAQEIYNKTMEDLKKIPDVEWVFEEKAVIEIEDAESASQKMLKNNVDGLVIISGTFHLGHLALIFNKYIKKPILLWAFDELPYDGGKIRLNSVCGLNLNASNLYKAGNDHYTCTIGGSIDKTWLAALRVKAVVENARIGLVGYRAHGFFNVGTDDLDVYRKTGILIDHFEISDMFSQPVDDSEVKKEREEILRLFNCKELTDRQIENVARLCVSAAKFMGKYQLTAAAIRCWPEYAANYGVSPCATMSILQSRGMILGCEGDIEGTLSMLAARAMGAETPFLADLSQVDLKEDFALMWHCGVAPLNLWDGKCERTLDTYFAGGKGVTAGFVMKSGHVNVMRIDTARGKTRMFVAAGEAVDMKKQLCGTYAKVKFEQHITEVLDKVVYTGLAHHVTMVYGEYRDIMRVFAKMMDYEIIE